MQLKTRVLAAGVIGLALTLSACSGAGSAPATSGGSAGEKVTLNLATVNNGNMKDMEKLKTVYEQAHPGVTVNFNVMEEGDLRSAVTADVAAKGGQYDIVTIGAYETPQWGKNGWLVDLTQPLTSDATYDVNDLLPPVRVALTYDSKLFAVPFYGESSILMYNKDLAAKAGVTISNTPTWTEIADAAKKLNSADTAGICMRGKPGGGHLFAPLTSVIHTFRAHWYDNA